MAETNGSNDARRNDQESAARWLKQQLRALHGIEASAERLVAEIEGRGAGDDDSGTLASSLEAAAAALQSLARAHRETTTTATELERGLAARVEGRRS